MKDPAKKHDRKLGLLAAELVKVRFRVKEMPIGIEVQDEMDSLLISSNYLVNAPFEWVTLSHRYGLKNEEVPHYEKINKKYGDLPLAIELDANELREADRDEFKRLLSVATLKALIHAGHKYNLPVKALEDRLGEISNSPSGREAAEDPSMSG